MKRETKYYRCGCAPFVVFGPTYESKGECEERAKQENACGEYRGRGVKVVQTDEGGRIVLAKKA